VIRDRRGGGLKARARHHCIQWNAPLSTARCGAVRHAAEARQGPRPGAGRAQAADREHPDNGRTALVPTIVPKREGILDEARYDGARGVDGLEPAD